MLRASQVRRPCGMRTEPVLMVHVLKRPARVQVNSIRQLHRRRRKLSEVAKHKKNLVRKMSSRTWRNERWTSPIPPKRYDITTASSACARSSRLTTATTLQIASFDPSAHRFCLRKCSGPSKSRWSDYSHLQAVILRGLPAGRSSRRLPTACSSRSSRS